MAITPVSKGLVFSFDDLGVPIDNIEGMTFGPTLPDGGVVGARPASRRRSGRSALVKKRSG